MRKLTTIIGLLLLAGTAAAQLKLPGEKNTNLPGPWKDASPQERFKAVRVAEVDAMRQLAERIYGLDITAGTRVYDFMVADDRIEGEMQAVLHGAVKVKTIEGRDAPVYMEDGTVYVGYAVPLRKVYEVIESSVKRKGNRVLQAEYERRIERDDRLIEALGNGALPGTQGMRRIRAKRAAEMDAFRLMAERVLGVRITSKTAVRDFVLASDEVTASLTATLKGLKPIDITYDQQDACEVTMQLKIRKVYEVIDRVIRENKGTFHTKKEVVTKITEQVEDEYFTVTGKGAPRDATLPPPTTTADGVWTEERTTIKRLVGVGVAID